MSGFCSSEWGRIETNNRPAARALLETGFELLQRIPRQRIDQGYFVALHLGFILKLKDQFKPDQQAEKYQGPGGLTKDFFQDTVRNALAWQAREGVPPD